MVHVPPLPMVGYSPFGTTTGFQLLATDQLPAGTFQFWAWPSDAAPTTERGGDETDESNRLPIIEFNSFHCISLLSHERGLMI